MPEIRSDITGDRDADETSRRPCIASTTCIISSESRRCGVSSGSETLAISHTGTVHGQPMTPRKGSSLDRVDLG